MEPLQLFELTPRGAGAVSVLLLQGPGALERASSLCERELQPGELSVVRLRAAGEDLDEALILVRSQREVELQLHGSPPLVRKLRATLGLDARVERAGMEDRALERLASAPSAAGARILLDQSEGALTRRIAAWGGFCDDELLREREALVEDSRVARYALEPIRVVLAGPVNAGKSTLFNALLGQERVITSAEEGTTRDLVVQRADLGGWPAELVDTAGERQLDREDLHEQVELEGQRRARAVRGTADVVLWLRPPGGPPASAAEGPGVLLELATKADLTDGAGVSALDAPEQAVRQVAELVRGALGLPLEAWSPGLGVAFDAESRAWLGALDASDPAAIRRAAACLTGSAAQR